MAAQFRTAIGAERSRPTSLARPDAARAGRARPPARLPARAAVGRGKAAGGDRPGAGQRPPADPSRRTHRQPRQRHRPPGGAAAAPAGHRGPPGGGDRQPRRPPGGDRRPGAVARGRHLPGAGHHATDPVCGMAVPQHDHPHLQRDGVTWWFCSVACREEFAADPGRFASTQGPARRAVKDSQPDLVRRHDPSTNSPRKDQAQPDIL
jgi:YHS domain-containing protein